MVTDVASALSSRFSSNAYHNEHRMLGPRTPFPPFILLSAHEHKSSPQPNPTEPNPIQVKDVPPLPDRVAAVLAPHLPVSPPPSPLLTAAAAAVNASVSSVGRGNGAQVESSVSGDGGENAKQSGVQTAVNGATPLRKEGLLAALRAVGVGVKAPTVKRKGAKGGANSRKKDPLAAGLLAAIQVCEARHYTTRLSKVPL